jgi:striatin 1/3/4
MSRRARKCSNSRATSHMVRSRLICSLWLTKGSCRTDGTPATQINSVATHPTLPILVTAHEDRYIRIFDTNTGSSSPFARLETLIQRPGECTHSMIAHQDAVTSVDIDSAGLNVVSGGHDCSVRFWDLLSTRTCLQEIASHRPKGGEGVLAVRYHPSLPYVASAGADSVVKVYSFPS